MSFGRTCPIITTKVVTKVPQGFCFSVRDFIMVASRCITCVTTFPLLIGKKEMFYLTTHSTHFIYDYMEGRKCFI